MISEMKIYIKPLTGGQYPLEVKPTDSIKDIKVKIQEKEGIKVEFQRLVVKQILEDEKTLLDYNIQPESIIYLIRKSITNGEQKIFIRILTGKQIQLDFEPSNSVESIKAQIQAIEGIPIEKQILIFAGKQLENDKTLSDCKIQSEQTLHIVFLYQTLVKKQDGQIIVLDIGSGPFTTIKNVKTKLQEKEGIPSNKQKLVFEEIELEDDEKTLMDYNIKEESIIDLIE